MFAVSIKEGGMEKHDVSSCGETMVQMQRGELMETKGGMGGFPQVRVSTGS